MLVVKPFVDLSRLEIKNFYDLVSKSDMNKEIDNSILWELLYLRQIMSEKDSKKLSSVELNNKMRLDYVIYNDNDAIGYFCVRRITNKVKIKYELILFINEANLDSSIINRLEKELINIKNKYYLPTTIFNLSVSSNNIKMTDILDKSSFKLIYIDNKTYNIAHKIYEI